MKAKEQSVQDDYSERSGDATWHLFIARGSIAAEVLKNRKQEQAKSVMIYTSSHPPSVSLYDASLSG